LALKPLSAQDSNAQKKQWPGAAASQQARSSSPPQNSTKRDFMIKFEDVVSKMAQHSFYVFKSLTPAEQDLVHRFAPGFDLYHWDEWQVVRHNRILVTVISNREQDKDKATEIPQATKRGAVVSSLATASKVIIPNDPRVAEIVAAKKVTTAVKEQIVCQKCGRTCKTLLGLGSHMRTHRDN
jgi:predicted transcriptional regulator